MTKTYCDYCKRETNASKNRPAMMVLRLVGSSTETRYDLCGDCYNSLYKRLIGRGYDPLGNPDPLEKQELKWQFISVIAAEKKCIVG